MRFVELVKQAGSEGDIRDLVRKMDAEKAGPAQKPDDASLSKREVKRVRFVMTIALVL